MAQARIAYVGFIDAMECTCHWMLEATQMVLRIERSNMTLFPLRYGLAAGIGDGRVSGWIVSAAACRNALHYMLRVRIEDKWDRVT